MGLVLFMQMNLNIRFCIRQKFDTLKKYLFYFITVKVFDFLKKIVFHFGGTPWINFLIITHKIDDVVSF